MPMIRELKEQQRHALNDMKDITVSIIKDSYYNGRPAEDVLEV